jgi:uncharacterized protein (DUF302 family)
MFATATRTPHGVVRLDIATGIPFDDFRAAFESAAPVFDRKAVQNIVAAGGDWDDVRGAVRAAAPNELMVFTSIDARPLMSAAGHNTPAVEYLLGNPVVAEQMFCRSSLALLYAPLRILVHSDAGGDAIFTLDQPSILFASLNDPAVTEVGRELDRKVAHLLTVVGVDAAAAFAEDGPTQ